MDKRSVNCRGSSSRRRDEVENKQYFSFRVEGQPIEIQIHLQITDIKRKKKGWRVDSPEAQNWIHNRLGCCKDCINYPIHHPANL